MKSPTRRTALIGACATVATLLAKTEAVAADPRLEDIQALVSDLRNCDRSLMMAVWVAFQEVADRLEALPGVVPVPNQMWRAWRAEHHEKPTNLEYPIGPYLTTGRV